MRSEEGTGTEMDRLEVRNRNERATGFHVARTWIRLAGGGDEARNRTLADERERLFLFSSFSFVFFPVAGPPLIRRSQPASVL